MKVTAIATIIAGKDAKEYAPGSVLDISDQKEANYLIERGLVSPAREKKSDPAPEPQNVDPAPEAGDDKQEKKDK